MHPPLGLHPGAEMVLAGNQSVVAAPGTVLQNRDANLGTAAPSVFLSLDINL